MVSLSVKGTCGPEVVRVWSEFGSEFGSEIEIEWGPVLSCAVDFSVMVEVSESEIISSESEIISSSSEVKRILEGDLSREGGLSKDLLWGVLSILGVFSLEGEFG